MNDTRAYSFRSKLKSGLTMILLIFFCVSLAGCAEKEKTLEDHIRDLKSHKYEVYGKASDELVKMGAQAVPGLIEALKDEKSRGHAAGALGKIKDDRAVDPLIECLDASSDETPGEVIMALIDTGAPAAMNALTERGKQNHKAVLKVLTDNVGRKEVDDVLVSIGDPAIKALISTFRNNRPYKEAADVLSKMGKTALEALIQQLGGTNSKCRAAAAYAIGNMNDPDVVQPLINALIDEDSLVRTNAAYGLRGCNEPAVIEALASCTEDSSKPVRNAASEALITIGTPEALDVLAKSNNTDAMIRFHVRKVNMGKAEEKDKAIEALVDMGEPALKVVLSLLDPRSRQEEDEIKSISEIIGGFGEPAYKQLLELVFADSLYPRLAAGIFSNIGPDAANFLISTREQLKKESSDNFSKINDLDEIIENMGHTAVDALIEALKDASPAVRREAVYSLSELGDKRAVEPLIQALRDSDATVRQSAAGALGDLGDIRAAESLMEALKDNDAAIRMLAADALGRLGDARAQAPLIEALNGDSDEDVKNNAAYALGKLKCPAAIDRLIHLIKTIPTEENYSAKEALVSIGPEAVKRLIELLDIPDAAVRWNAAEILGNMDSPALQPLHDAMADENLEIVAGAYLYYIMKGKNETAGTLVKALDTHGTVKMAEDYLNCGNEVLVEAAEKWAEKHGYRIEMKSEGSGRLWGSGRN